MSGDAAAQRQKRLEEALRANLRKRKSQARDRAQTPQAEAPEADAPGESTASGGADDARD